ncbi:MAG: serine/threonine-protein phosphatase [Firmicutes bacterium]|nr:serine/threonine-protein phosphatase [Bacillota bacterium]
MKDPRKSIVFKSIFGIVFLLFVFAVIVNIIGYKGFTNSLLTLYTEDGFRTAETAAELIDGDKIDEYEQSGGVTQEYKAVWNGLDRLCNSQGVTFIYLIRPDRTDYGHIKFIFSTINKESEFTPYEFGYLRETTNDEYREKYKNLYDGKTEKEVLIRDKGYIETGSHITIMIPVKDSKKQVQALLCVQRQMDGMTRSRRNYVENVSLVLIILAIVVIIGQGVYMLKAFLAPVKMITAEAARFANENAAMDGKLTDTIKNTDEIGVLADSIDKMESRIENYINHIETITAEKERINTELSLATRIQYGMLPHTFPAFPDNKEFDIYASMDPAKEVGGDFYDFFMTDDTHLCMVMADVSGKGVPAALFMMATKIILATNAKMGKSPAEVLTTANDRICANNHEEMFVTVWLGILDITTGKVIAANAGHEFPILMQPNGEFELFKDKHGFVVGGIDGVAYKEYEFTMQPGAKLFLYTDGLPEATDKNNEMFGTERVLDVLNKYKTSAPKEILNGVKTAVEGFVKDAEQFDDMTMLAIHYYGAE